MANATFNTTGPLRIPTPRGTRRATRSALLLASAAAGVVGAHPRRAAAQSTPLNQVNLTATQTSASNYNTSGAWSDSTLDVPGNASSYLVTNASNPNYNANVTPSQNVYNIGSYTLYTPALVASSGTLTDNFYGGGLQVSGGTIVFNGSSGGNFTRVYNFPNLTNGIQMTDANLTFTNTNTATNILNAGLLLADTGTATNTITVTGTSPSQYLVLNGAINGTGSLTFKFTGTETGKNVLYNASGGSFTGPVILGSVPSITSAPVFNLNRSIGSTASYNASVAGWTLNDNAVGGLNTGSIGGSALNLVAGTTANLGAAVTSESFGNLTGAGNVTALNTSNPVTLTLTGTGTYTGVLAGAMLTLVKNGTGSQTIGGVNTYGGSTTVNAGTLTVGSLAGTGTVTLNGGILASGAAGTIAGGLLAGTGANTIAPGGIGTVGTLTVGGLTTGSTAASNATTLAFDLGTATSGIAANGDLFNVSSGSVTIGSGTQITLTSSGIGGVDYRLFGGNSAAVSAIYAAYTGGSLLLPAAPSGASYSLSDPTSAVDPGYVDLIVTANGPRALTWNNAGGTGNGATWDNVQQDFHNGSSPAVFSSAAQDTVTFNDANNGNYNVSISGIVTPGSTTVTTASTYAFNGSGGIDGIGGNGGLTVNGTGTVILATSNSFTGGTTLASGTLVLQNTSALSLSTLSNTGGTLLFDPAVTTNAFTVGGLSGSAPIALQNTAATPAAITLTVGGNNAPATYGGSLTGVGNLVKAGAGTLSLTGSNTFTGTTAVTGGTLLLSNSSALSGSTLTTGGIAFHSAVPSHAFTLGGLSGSTALALTDTASNPVALSVGNNNGSTTYSGVLSGAGSLTTVGTGTLALSGTSTFTGATTVSGGVLQVLDPATSGTADTMGQLATSSAIAVQNGGTLQFYRNPSATTTQTVSIPSVTLYNGSSVQIESGNATLTYNFTNNFDVEGSTTISEPLGFYSMYFNGAGVLSGPAASTINVTTANGTGRIFTFSNGATTYAGNWTVTGTNTSTGATTLTAAAAGALGTGTVTLNAYSLLTSGTTANGLSSLAGVILTAPTATVTTANGGWVNAGASLNMSAGTANLGTASSSGGSVTIGTLTQTGGTINLGPTTLNLAGGTSSGTISGAAGSLAVNGGALALSGANTYGGGTTLTAGKLMANGPTASLGTGTTTVNGGVLGGGIAGNATAAATGGPVVINAGGTITAGSGATAGDSIGTLSTGAQTWSAGGGYVAKVTSDGTTTSNDLLQMSDLTITGSFAVTVLAQTGSAAVPAATPLVLAYDSDPTQTGVFANALLARTLTLSPNSTVAFSKGMTATLSESDTAAGEYLVLATSAAPEPTSLLLAPLAAAPLVLGRRRRRSPVA